MQVHGSSAVSLRDVSDTFVRYRWTALIAFSTCFLTAVLVALLMTPVFRAEVLVVPAQGGENAGGLESLIGKFGGLAGLAGIELPFGEGTPGKLGLEVLESRGFLEEFIRTNALLPELFPGKWDPAKKSWAVDDEDIPTLNEGVERFQRKVLKIKSDADSGTVRIIVDWRDRVKSAELANALVAALNERMRNRAIDESARSLEYLDRQLRNSSTLEVRQSVYGLMEEQLNKAMLASVRREYVFEVLDPAAPADADEPQRPKRLLLIALGFLAGIAVAALAVVIRAGLSAANMTRDN